MNPNMLYWHEDWQTAVLFDGKVHRIRRTTFTDAVSGATQTNLASRLRAVAELGRIATAEATPWNNATALLAPDQTMFGGGGPQTGFKTEEARLFFKGVGRQLRHPGEEVCIRRGSESTHFESELAMLFSPVDGLPIAVTLSIDVGANDLTKDPFDPEAKAYTGAMGSLPMFAVWNKDGSCPLDGNAVIRMSFERPNGGGPSHHTEMTVAKYLAAVPSLQNMSGTGKRLLAMSNHSEGVFITPGKAGLARTDEHGIQVGDVIIVTIDGLLPELRMQIGTAA